MYSTALGVCRPYGSGMADVVVERGAEGGADVVPSSRLRVLFSTALVVALAAAVYFQRALFLDAVAQLRSMSAIALVVIAALAVYERWSRADIVRRLLDGHFLPGGGVRRVSTVDAVVIHDVGNAISKAIPLGGALGTAVRWSIVRRHGVPAPRFAVMLIAYGIATTFASWLLPFAALGVDLLTRTPDTIDWVMLTVMAVVLFASAAFWVAVLASDGVERWGTRWLQRVWARLARRFTALGEHDPASGVAIVRAEMRQLIAAPWRLLGLTVASQACGALVLLVALRALGVEVGGPDAIGLTEFFRIFFIVGLLGSFAPTPGGVGAVEAGMTGALAAAGIDPATALAAVLVYRFVVYLLPIMLGSVAYAGWRWRTPEADAAVPDPVAVSTP